MQQFQGLLGIATLVLIGIALCPNRRAINWRIVLGGLILQSTIAFLLLRVDRFVGAFDFFAAIVARVVSFADAGIQFIFGKAADASAPWGFIFVVKVLPIIIFFASLMAVLYHLGVMQRLVAAIAWLLRRTLGLTGAEALSSAANIFLGQTEAPLVVRPYIATLTRSQLMSIMTGGFASIAGSVMAAYINMLGPAYAELTHADPESGRILFAKHLMIASVMSAPASFVFAKLLVPETEIPRAESVSALMADERTTHNVIDAAAEGATDGLKLALNVAAMLVAFVALLAMINWPLNALGNWTPIAEWRAAHGLPEFSLQNLLGFVLRPLAWTLGVSWDDSRPLATLLGTQVIATEFVAYADLATQTRAGAISPRGAQIATYCLCGFANIASIGIQIGGLGAMAPSRRSDMAALAPRAMLAGAMSCWMTGATAGLFL